MSPLRVALLRVRLDLAAVVRDLYLLSAVLFYPAVMLLADRENPVLLAGMPTAAAAFAVGLLVLIQVGRERFDGTLLRLRALPGGLRAYLAGRVAAYLVLMLVAAVLTLAVAVRGAVELPRSVTGWALLVGGVVLGALAFATLAVALTAALPSANPTGGASVLGQLLIVAVVLASSNLVPVGELPAAIRAVVLALPVFWGGHLVRAGLLDERHATAEPGGEFEPLLALAVLAAWIVAGGFVALRLLARSARRPAS